MQHCDILILGGGPAGSTCARKLRAAGVDVLILDKRTFPRDKTCAGWVTPAVVQELELDTADYAKTRVFQPITGFITGTIGGKAVESHYDKPVSYGIRRFEFDHYLLERSAAPVRLGEKFESAERTANGWIVNGEIEAKMLVGAGGHFCPVARLLQEDAGRGSAKPQAAEEGAGEKELVVAAQEIEFEMMPAQLAACKVRPEVPELYFCRDLMGYAWCFRKGNFLNVGLGREDNVRVAEHVAEFRELMKSQGRIPRDTPDKFHGHAYILYGHTRRELVGDNVMLIGDSAGLAYPESGEGIRPAVESALIAADVLTSAGGDYRAASLRPYVTRLTQRLGARGETGVSPKSVPGPFKQKLAGYLLATKWFSRHVVIDRWFLHAQQAAL